MSGINLTPTEEFLEAPDLSRLVEHWLLSLDVEPVTLLTYRDKIVHFVRWWEEKGPTVAWRLTRSLLQEFEVSLRGIVTKRFAKTMAYGNRHAVIRTVRIMFKWASETGRTVRNYGTWVPWPSGSTPHRKAVTPAHLARLMLAASESRYPLRDQTLLAFFIGTGCRRSEVASLCVEDLKIMEDGSGTALVTGKRTSANPTGQRAVAFDASTGQWLQRYLDETALTAGGLWISDEGTRLHHAGLYQIVVRVIKRAGLTEHVHGCHDLRRAFATILAKLHPNSPGWADIIRRQLGHKYYSQTTAYTLLDVDDLRAYIVTPLHAQARPANNDNLLVGNQG